MAYSTGTATDYLDLLDKLKAFVILQGWTAERDEVITDRFLYLKGPDISIGAAVANVCVNIRAFQNPTAPYYNWQIRGATSYTPFDSFSTQPGTHATTYPFLVLSNSTITYHFMVNDRRIILLAQIGSNFYSMYAGLIIPYATPTEFPYPLYIGATGSVFNLQVSTASFFVGSAFDPTAKAAVFRGYNGVWMNLGNYADSNGNRNSIQEAGAVFPYTTNSYEGGDFVPNEDGSYTLMQTILSSESEGRNVYGELDGIFYLSGFGQAPGNTITVGADTYLVWNAVYRTAIDSFTAIKVE